MCDQLSLPCHILVVTERPVSRPKEIKLDFQAHKKFSVGMGSPCMIHFRDLQVLASGWEDHEYPGSYSRSIVDKQRQVQMPLRLQLRELRH